VARLNIKATFLQAVVDFHVEKLLKDVVAVFEVRISDVKSQLNEHIVVLVVGQAEAVPLQHFSIRNASVANINLASLWVNIVVGSYLELILFGHILQCQFPDPHRFFFTQHDFLTALNACS